MNLRIVSIRYLRYCTLDIELRLLLTSQWQDDIKNYDSRKIVAFLDVNRSKIAREARSRLDQYINDHLDVYVGDEQGE